MATQRNKKTGTVDPELRRKMLERWENEGGKIGDTEARPLYGAETKAINTRKTRPTKNSYL